LQAIQYNNVGVVEFARLVIFSRQDVAKMPYVVVVEYHASKAILDIQFAELERVFPILVHVRHHALDEFPELNHRFGQREFIGGVIH